MDREIATYRIRKYFFSIFGASADEAARKDVGTLVKSYRPLSLWNMKLDPPGTGTKRSWDDVGGMERVKQVITETIIWPGKVCVLCIS